jgi:glycine/D-amino acid oxidase-like deaminating enzyme
MSQQFDAIVLGAGGMGSAAYYLAAAGQKVLPDDGNVYLYFARVKT